MIVVDSSAVVAIALREPGYRELAQRIVDEAGAIISVANYVESGQVLAQRQLRAPRQVLTEFHGLLRRLGIRLAPIDEAQARVALEARIRYGRGFGHPARLNYSDCFAYALAKTRNLPLLFKGEDFTHTDIIPALA